jgi:lysophospholipase L1-like esterase
VTTLRYVALGDSYTIGTSVDEEDRWPNQLVRRLTAATEADAATTPDPPTPAETAADAAPPLDLVANLAVNGYSSHDVIEHELPRLDRFRPEFASLLIGVNDVVQRVPAEAYRRNVAQILDSLLGRLGPKRIVAVATPDYTVTPSGASFGDPARQSAGIAVNNTILRELAQERGVGFVDIFDLSRRVGGERTMVARDGLHPSGAQYRLWVDAIEPVVRALLRNG